MLTRYKLLGLWMLALCSPALGAWSGALGTAAGPRAAQEGERYVRVAPGGAKLLNYRDVQSSVWRSLAEGEVLRVTGEQVLEPPGEEKLVFLEVEVAGGLPVWVFGEFLEPAGVSGVLRTTTRVNMRPKPSSDQSSMAHPLKLDKGEHVRLIERADQSKPMAEDWVKVWSPERARAWVLASETQPATDSAAARQAFTKASELLRNPRESAAPPVVSEASAQRNPAAQQAKATEAAADLGREDASQALAAARALYEQSLDQKGAKILDAVAAYERALELAGPGTPLRRQAEVGLQQARSYAEIVALNQQIQSADAERERLREQLKREEELAQRQRDPLWGRYTARGWIAGRVVDGERRYYMQWRNEEVCEIVCTVGRYDLELFEGYEVGIMGAVSRGPLPASDTGPAQPQLLDLYRIEVISGGDSLR